MMLTAFKPSIEEKIIIASLRDVDAGEKADHIRKMYTPDCDDALWQAACLNQVAPIVGHALMDTFGAENIPVRWVNIHKEKIDCISAYLIELDRVTTALIKEGVSVILIENAALAKAIYPCPGCFEFGDLDFLVRVEQLSVLVRVLAYNGYNAYTGKSILDGTPDLTNGRAEYGKILTDGYPLRLNFQWSLVARRWFDAVREPSIVALFSRSVPITGCAARMLCSEDNLFQLAVHNASHAYIRKPGIRLHLDIDRFVNRVSINWKHFIELVQRYQVNTQVYFSLSIPKTLFNTPIPDEVLGSLRPPLWKEHLISHWLTKAGFFNPDGKKFSRLGYVLFTFLLYDDLKGLYRAIFPDIAWMSRRYGAGLISLHYLRRLMDLIFRRLST